MAPLRIEYSPSVLKVGTHVILTVRAARRDPVQLTVTAPSAATRRLGVRPIGGTAWRATIVITRAGRWAFRATQGSRWATLGITVLAQKTNTILGPLGAADCDPPSPRNRVNRGVSHAEVFGTSVRGRLWGLFAFLPAGASWASDGAAEFDDLVGKQMKVVFKFDARPDAFYSVAPDGNHVTLVWGPDYHGSSSWKREGVEWGAGFVFQRAGCWRIHATAGQKTGDIWVDVVS